MTSDSSDSTRRSKRSSSDVNDSRDTSKRRKHHHRKHRQHNHQSRKHDGIADATEILEEKRNEHNSSRNDAVVAGEMGTAVNGTCLGIDYDMEEGEIIEEKEGGGLVGNGAVSFDNYSMGGKVSLKGENNNSGLPLEDHLNQKHRKSGPLVVDMDYRHNSKGFEGTENNGVDREGRFKADDISGNEYGGLSNSYFVESDVNNVNSSLSSESGEKKHRCPSISPSWDNHPIEKFSRRNLEKSPQHSRATRSRSGYQYVSQSDTKEVGHAYPVKRNYGSDSDDERVTDHQTDYRHRSRDYLRDNGRDRSPSYVRRMSQLDMSYLGGETHGRFREGSFDTRSDRSPEREREREREKGRERERDWDRNKGRDRDREHDRDRDRGRERERHRDRETEDRVRREHEKESSRYGDKYKNRDTEGGREHIHRKYDVHVVSYGNRDRYDDTLNRRHGEPHVRERRKQSDIEKAIIPKGTSFKKAGEKFKSDEDEQEDYEDRIALQLANQEEDDLEKIKEESRRRREAILEKNSGKKLQQESEGKVEYNGNFSSEQPPEIGSAVNGVPESADAQVEVSDDYDGTPKSERSNDMFSDDIFGESPDGGQKLSERSNDMFSDDIFGESPDGGRKLGKADSVLIEKSSLHDNWDDAEGYYSYRFGEILDSRYEIIAAHGKGVFSTVIRAKDLKAEPGDPEEVAIKMIRSNDTMYKAGIDEMVILKKLVGADPENRRHCVRFLSNFKYRNHLCLVFESLHMNLREILKKFGRNIGLKLTAVREYAKQLFIALKHLKNCGILHCDIKPDNMLVNEAKNILKLCDFGSAMFAGKNEVTPYLVSRFYRAPEIILGLPYDHPVDMWSVGCCLFELFTGKVVFPGSSNNDMLRLHMELKGPFPKKMLRKGSFTVHHFDQDLNFVATEEDPVTKKAIKRLMINMKQKDVGNLISTFGEDPKMLANFKDLVEKTFVLDPEKRITVSQALNHPFIMGK